MSECAIMAAWRFGCGQGHGDVSVCLGPCCWQRCRDLAGVAHTSTIAAHARGPGQLDRICVESCSSTFFRCLLGLLHYFPWTFFHLLVTSDRQFYSDLLVTALLIWLAEYGLSNAPRKARVGIRSQLFPCFSEIARDGSTDRFVVSLGMLGHELPFLLCVSFFQFGS